MASFRTPELNQKYKEYREAHSSESCALCDRSGMKVFKHWKVLENMFPYDRIARVHHMVVPLRHVTEHGLSKEELSEMAEIKAGFIQDGYDFIMEATDRTKTIPAHFHLHLIVMKEM